MNEKARQALAAAGWAPGRVYDTTAIADLMPARGFVMHDAAKLFLGQFGGLRIHQKPTVPRDTTCYFHTQPDTLAADPWWNGATVEVSGSLGFPVGATGFGEYVLMIDQRGRFFGIDQYGEATFWAEDADELFDIVLGDGGTFRPCDPEDHRPL